MSRTTSVKAVRAPIDLWAAAQEKAAAEGTTVNAVLVAALRQYANAATSTGP